MTERRWLFILILPLTPLITPLKDEDRLTWLRLLRSRRVGISTFYRLLEEHGTAHCALKHLPEVARAAGVENYVPHSEEQAIAEMRRGQNAGANLIFWGTPSYPAAFNDLNDARPFFWAVGDATLLHRPTLGLARARNASSLGTRMLRFLATTLGKEGYVICSGLARGVDKAAHAAAIGTGTIAVLGGGIDVVYPAENAQLKRQIRENGLLVSEQPMGTQPQARHFPVRNRLISGLSQAIVVIEAVAKSGSLITAKTALDQGRDVYAVPGHPFDARASGCNILIRDGATLVRNAEDIIEALPKLPQQTDIIYETPKPLPNRGLRETAKLHQRILARLSPSPLAEDQLIRDLKASAAQIAPALVDLEIEGQIERQSGGLVSLSGNEHKDHKGH